MDALQKVVAERCLAAAEAGSMTFPQIVTDLMNAGFESYAIDFRLGRATYYLPSGDAAELPAPAVAGAVAEAFDEAAMVTAIREARALVPGYTYIGFCAKARAAGCAGYVVSFPGRRAVYFGRTAETLVEPFPTAT
jgi:uncharacterized protein YbcV (DUF1398 family)